MNVFQRRAGLALASVVAAGFVWACTATRRSDGSVEISFAPDMCIQAWGLEDALSKLMDLLDECITGNFHRPCTSDEMAAINQAIKTVAEKKGSLGELVALEPS